jgi:hypothetical protein
LIAVGSLAFIDEVRSELGSRPHIAMSSSDGSYVLREMAKEYALKFAAETEALRSQNTFFGKKSFDEATT